MNENSAERITPADGAFTQDDSLAGQNTLSDMGTVPVGDDATPGPDVLGAERAEFEDSADEPDGAAEIRNAIDRGSRGFSDR